MQQRLLKNSQDLVSNSFRDHIILKVIEKSCKQYESRMNTMRFSTIEFFRRSSKYDRRYQGALCRL